MMLRLNGVGAGAFRGCVQVLRGSYFLLVAGSFAHHPAGPYMSDTKKVI